MFHEIIKRPKITLLFLSLITIVGIITFTQLPQRDIPEITFNISTISTSYPGATAEEVERNVTNPIENAIQGIEGIEHFSSVSLSSFSSIIIEMDDQANQTDVLSSIRQAVANAESEFPETALSPVVSDDIQLGALSSYHIMHEDRENLELINNELLQWKNKVIEIPGVKDVLLKGTPDELIQLMVYNDLLQENGVNVPQIINAIDSELTTFPLGSQEMNNKNYQMMLPSIQNSNDMLTIFIGESYFGEGVYFQDIGDVQIGKKVATDLITYEGTPAISFTIIPEEGINIPTLYTEVDRLMNEFESQLQDGYTVKEFHSQQTIINDVFSSLSMSFILSIVAVILITFLGLNLASAFIVSIAIPVSIFIGMVALPYLNVDLNQISIIGFIIALGILVDDAIVVGDNIQRKYQEGLNPLDGAIEGSREVRVSIITSTLAIVFTFLPLLFISGTNGDFIRAMPSVLIMTIIASTIVSLTLVPIFLRWRQERLLSKSDNSLKVGLIGKQLDRLAKWYSQVVLKKVIKHPWKISIVGLLFCSLCYLLIPFIPVEFFPSADREEVMIEVRLPHETTIETTEVTLIEMVDFIVNKEEVENLKESSIYAGTGLPPLFGQVIGNTGPNTGEILIRIDRDNISAEQFIADWTSPLQEKYPEAIIELSTIEAGPPVGAPIAIKVTGPDLDDLNVIGNDLMAFITSLPEAATVVDDQGPYIPTLNYIPDRALMEQHGITLQDISQQIGMITDGIPLGGFDDGLNQKELQLVVMESEENESVPFSEVILPSNTERNDNGSPVFIPLDQLVTSEITNTIPRVSHENGKRILTIRVFPTTNGQELEQKITEYRDQIQGQYNDYSIIIGGETEARDDFFTELMTLFFIVIFLVYIIMVIQFYSFLMPLLIMSTVFLAVTGAIIGLFVTQTGLGFMAMMGIVSLSGIVVRNSIVLLEFIEQKRKDGSSLDDAVLEAGEVRLRPILLTAFTAIAALIPIAFSGDVLFVPLAISIISGLLFSAVFTVVLVPAFYTAVKRPRKLKKP